MARKTSFYFAFLTLPAPKRRAILAVFDFCRAVDDGVDLEHDPSRAAAAVARWRDEVERIFSSAGPRTAEGRELKTHVAACGLTRGNFDALIDGVEMDIAPRRFPTFADLEPYCHRVASAVGLMCIEVFGVADPRARDYARDLGVALQLTNILRDVGADYVNGRVYVPQEDFDRFGVSDADIAREVAHAGSGIENGQVRAMLESQAARAREFFSRAVAALPDSERSTLVAAETMREIYAELLGRIERAGYDVFSTTVRVPRLVRVGLAARTWWRSRASR